MAYTAVRNERSSRERKFQGTNGPGNECSRERIVLGTNSGIATGGTGGTRPPPTCPKDRLWDSSRSDEKLVRLVGTPPQSEYLRCAPKYTISRLNNQKTPPRTLPPSAPSASRFSRLWRSSPPLKNPGYAPVWMSGLFR